MEKFINVIKIVLSVVVGTIASALGGNDSLLTMGIIMSFSDVIFGSAKGIKNKNFSSSILLWGLVNKAIMFGVIAIMVKVDAVLGRVGFLRNAFIIWFSLCDAASMIENSASLGVPWPEGLLNVLVQVRKGFSINLSKIVKQIIDNYNVPIDKDGE